MQNTQHYQTNDFAENNKTKHNCNQEQHKNLNNHAYAQMKSNWS